jgi:hypothetical protein
VVAEPEARFTLNRLVRAVDAGISRLRSPVPGERAPAVSAELGQDA